MLVEVGDGEGHLGLFTAGPGVVLPDSENVVAGLGDERHMCPHGLHRRDRQLVSRDEPSQPEEPVVVRSVTQLGVEVAQGVDIGWSSGTDPDGPARDQQHVAFERRQLLIVLRTHHGGHLSPGRHVVEPGAGGRGTEGVPRRQ